MRQLRVVAVDDSRTFRTQLAAAIEATGSARVVAHAGDGREALGRVAEFSPDLVTLDIEMPIMNGIETLTELRKRHPAVKVVMVSSLTREGAEITVKALSLGAHDFITKPSGADRGANAAELRAQLGEVLASLRSEPPQAIAAAPVAALPRRAVRPAIVAIGSSTGGPAALMRILPALPAALAVPVVIVQHMPPLFTGALSESLAKQSALKVVEAEDGMPLLAGTAYVAPGGRHLRVVAGPGGGTRVELTSDEPEHFCRPAVDYLFRSVADLYGEAALGVILTGMGKDGTAGLRAMKARGAVVLGQNEATCVVYGMPREAMAAGVVDTELAVDRIAEAIVATLKGSSPRS